jgi:hypothetical protein
LIAVDAVRRLGIRPPAIVPTAYMLRCEATISIR